jgi:N-methylhydantoinase A
MRIGVDTGGTFTDCLTFEGGEIKLFKVFSTPADAAQAILEGVQKLVGVRPLRSLELFHGTTVGTNSLLERKGARVALITTAGFEDLLEIGRQARPRLFDLDVRREPPLAPRGLRFGVKERTAADGKILLRPSTSALAKLKTRIKRAGAESLAVCFLFSYANPSNERAASRALEDLGIPISVSSQILPQFREFERLSTVVINAFLAPRMGIYLSRLEQQIADFRSSVDDCQSSIMLNRQSAIRGARGVKPLPYPRGRVYIMQSSGGVTTAARASREPVRTILSGPAGGVVASSWLANQLGIRRAISFDMGGTSTDVSLLDGPPRTTSETMLAGLPIAVPVLDVHSVGAGGGSLVRIDAGGALRVGPESAGADPGPICYGRGGAQPTVTDAHLLLGRLDPEFFLGGGYRLDLRAAERGFEAFLRQQPRQAQFENSRELARGIVAVSNATMEKALRVISVERGYDPRDFTLICYGGAGGLHAADLARALRLPRIIVPRYAGAFSALGILLSDVIKDSTQSVLLSVPETGEEASPGNRRLFREIQRRFQKLERAARAELRREGLAVSDRVRAERRLDVRYRGQSYELSVPFEAGFRERFQHEHQRAYGYAHPHRPLEIVNLRLRLVAPTAKPPARPQPVASPHASQQVVLKQQSVWFGKKSLRTRLVDRERLRAGGHFVGPAVIVEYSSTTVVPPDFECRVDRFLNLVLTLR